MYPQHICLEILDMKITALNVRNELLGKGLLNDGYHPEMEKVHLGNTKRLKEIIDEYGFPVLPLITKEISDAIFLIVQHAISYPEYVVSFYLSLKQLNDDEYNFVHLMHLEDRINFFLRLPQNYGTQFDYNEVGELEVYTLATEKKKIDKIRVNHGLLPIDEKFKELAKYQPLRLSVEENMKRMKAFHTFLEKSGWNKIKDRFT